MRCLMLLILLLAAGAQAAAPPILNFQGKVTDSVGLPMDTTVSMTFAIYDDQVGTTQLWQEVHPSVMVRGGIFQVMLGGGTPIGQSVLDGSVRYIGMAVAGGDMPDTLIPLVSVAYAMNSASSDTAAYAYHSRRADTATIALSGGGGSGGGWVDAGTTVTLENSNDSVGIGTDDPGYPLEVLSNGTAIYGLSTGGGPGGVGVLGRHQSDGIGVYARSESGIGVIGQSNTGWGGFFYGPKNYFAGRVGIGTDAPEEFLHLKSSVHTVFLKLQTTGQSTWQETGIRFETPQNRWHLRMDDHSNNNIPDGAIALRSQDADREIMTWTSDGLVGINTTAPEYPLDVLSSAVALRGRTTGGPATAGLYGRAENDGYGVMGTSTSGRGIYGASTTGFGGYFLGPKSYVSGRLGIGTEDPTHKLTVNGEIAIQSGGETKFHINYYNGGFNISETTVGDYRINVEEGGNVGIGTGKPEEKLHVAGNAKINGTVTAAGMLSTSLTDEAGLVGGSSYDFTVVPNTWITVASKTISVPGPGWILAIAGAHVDVAHGATGFTHCRMGISNITDSIPLNNQYRVGVDNFADASDYSHTPMFHEVFKVNSQGDYTYHFLAWKDEDNSVYIWRRSLTLIYFPTQYATKSSEYIEHVLNGATDHQTTGLKQEISSSAHISLNDEMAELRAELETLRQKVEALEM